MAFAFCIKMGHSDIIAYKTWFENLDEPAPDGAWNSIADQLDIDAAWDSISETLDLDDVWNNIESELPTGVSVSTPIQKHFPKLFWLAAALILLTLTTPLVDQSAGLKVAEPELTALQHKNEVEQVQQEVAASTQKRNDVPPVARIVKSEAVSESKSDKQVLLISSQPETDSIVRRMKYEEELIASIPVPHTLVGNEPVTDSLEIVPVDTMFCVAEITEEEDSDVQTKPIRSAHWQVGIIGSLKNTWLINPETTSGLKRTSLNDTRLTFGKEFGLTVQRSVGAKSAVQLEYYFYSEIGQRYHEYINALYQTKDIKLHYQKAQLIYRRRIFENTAVPALYAVAGLRVSRLTLADTSIGGEDENVTQEYRPWDYGFILGGEAEFNLSDKFILVSGLRASYGMRNIYLGNGQTPAEFNKTHTASVGVSVGVKYRINE